MNVPLRELHLFAGAGGGILGGMLLGHTPVCAVELEEYPRKVLLQRQRDGILPWFPIWDDVRTFDGRSWRGYVDIVCGGFPCQDISIAGKGAGLTGERSGLWSEMARVIGEIQPEYVLVENSPMLTIRGLDRVLYDLASMGYNAEWGVIGAHHAGAPHKRDRIWILAYSPQLFCNGGNYHAGISTQSVPIPEFGNHSRAANMADTDSTHGKRNQCAERGTKKSAEYNFFGKWWSKDPADETQSGMGRMAYGVANNMDRLKAIGNGQVPTVAALAWTILCERLNLNVA